MSKEFEQPLMWRKVVLQLFGQRAPSSTTLRIVLWVEKCNVGPQLL